MGKISEAQAILRAIGMPERQQTPICALSLLALAHIRPDDDWCQASNEWIRIHDIIQFVNLNYDIMQRIVGKRSESRLCIIFAMPL